MAIGQFPVAKLPKNVSSSQSGFPQWNTLWDVSHRFTGTNHFGCSIMLWFLGCNSLIFRLHSNNLGSWMISQPFCLVACLTVCGNISEPKGAKGPFQLKCFFRRYRVRIQPYVPLYKHRIVLIQYWPLRRIRYRHVLNRCRRYLSRMPARLHARI